MKKFTLLVALTALLMVSLCSVAFADVLTLPTIDVVPYLNMFTGWLTTNLPMLLSVAGGMGLVGFAFHKAKSFLHS